MHYNEININYNNVDKALLYFLPEFQIIYNEWSEESNNWEFKYIVFTPFVIFIIDNIDNKNITILEKIFTFIEMISRSNDQKIKELIYTSIFEGLENIDNLGQYFLTNTQKEYQNYLKLN